MKPDSKTVFLPISELEKYKNDKEYFCSAIVFSPETENQHFHGCPPYISIDSVEYGEIETLYFEVPSIVAYYAHTHAGYTMSGLDRREKEGERKLANKVKKLLGL